jgi:hypothetical protein
MGFGGVPLGGMGGRPGGLGMGMAPGAAGYGGMFDPSMRQLNFGAGMGTLGNEGEDAEDDASIVAKPEGKMPENFEYAPTGRRSNGLYDVRHAVVKVIIDSMRIPQFLTNLSKVNFMTVLLMTVNDVDEYEHLRGNAPSDGTGSSPRAMYIYGPHDAVELELVIETLWLRRWTAGHWDKEEADRLGEEFDKGLIPDDVRQLLGMHRRVPQGSTDERQAEDES